MIENQSFRLYLSILAAVLLSNCASITKGSTQIITVETPNCPGASCRITHNEGTYYVNKTPATIVVNRSNSQLRVNCTYGDKNVSMTDESNIEGMAFGNLLIGGIIGGGVDFATGAAYEYPQVISHPLICLSEKEKESEIEYLQRQIDELRKEGSNQDVEQVKNSASKKEINDLKVQVKFSNKVKPKLLESPQVDFPLPSGRNLSSTVVIVFDVDKAGRVFNSSIYKSSGNKDIDNLALNSVRESKYLPATEDGEVVIYREMKKRFKITR